MTTRKKLDLKNKKVGVLYSNWLAQIVALVKTRNLFLIAGRGSGKTNDFFTERLIDMIYELPGAPVALVSDTYNNLTKNILPILLDGLERKGFKEGVHYVVEREPPEVTPEMLKACPEHLREQFWKPYNRILSWKHRMIFFTGLNITFISLDRPSAAAGNSFVHVFGDESKYFPEAKIAKLTKALRGYYVKYGKSVYYRGQTFITDMPNPNNAYEYDWILKQVKRMDKKQVMDILRVAFVMNEVTEELIIAKESGDEKEIRNKQRLYERWKERYNTIRQKSTFFYVASSYINAAILRPEYFEDEFEGDLEDVLTAILSTKPRLSQGNKFYPAVKSENYYSDGSMEKYSAEFGVRDREDCRILKYLRRDEPIEAGMDFGNMISMTIGQEQGNDYRVLKCLHTLPPEWIRELADNFLAYFKLHEKKELHLFYDRAGNQYEKVKQDLAGKLKQSIEKDRNGKPTGWSVILESRNQATIFTWDEYDFMMELFSGNNPKLPRVLIDMYHAKPLKCSLEIAPVKIVEYKGKKRVSKDKRSEGLPVSRLLYESTNFSDSFKYLVMRKKWLRYTKVRQGGSIVGAG
ncbi:hypothetical protein [uncultured Butyricimonas sp.]|uniref:hypothetical protein n=1 Tax=uncultured Butyricimonas sp. TaxID=1268785 RepID=UPI0026DD2541|nr:hypothetical protein [uncultured Butyricimonas sp.]